MRMVTLRLFHQSDPFRQIEARSLQAGRLSIGRDVEAGWTIADAERAISRHHCTLTLDDDGLTLHDTSSNGVFLGPALDRAPAGRPVTIRPGDTLRLGQFIILVDGEAALEPPAASEFDAPFNRPLLAPVPVTGESVAVPSEWPDSGEATAAMPPTEGTMLEAFCLGAKLDASAFSGEDPAEVLRRLGAVYQQMVLGLSDLMGERTSVKSEYRMTRTTVRSEGNNPFRWAPPRRVAADLLRGGGHGFLSGPEAVKASFGDLKKHLLCMLAGMRAAVGATLQTLEPGVVEESLKGASFKLMNRAGAAWAEYSRLHRILAETADTDPDGPVNQAFREAYERELTTLDAFQEAPATIGDRLKDVRAAERGAA
jgi:predicted component of type VI protein secretion system